MTVTGPLGRALCLDRALRRPCALFLLCADSQPMELLAWLAAVHPNRRCRIQGRWQRICLCLETGTRPGYAARHWRPGRGPKADERLCLGTGGCGRQAAA